MVLALDVGTSTVLSGQAGKAAAYRAAGPGTVYGARRPGRSAGCLSVVGGCAAGVGSAPSVRSYLLLYEIHIPLCGNV
ncbi:hypothetical protein GCM10010363_20080 [Streptomyces omiyaensis]|nr:hypothetical protein GCM10010363_20080 [Streptomyces omiyaensis]